MPQCFVPVYQEKRLVVTFILWKLYAFNSVKFYILLFCKGLSHEMLEDYCLVVIKKKPNISLSKELNFRLDQVGKVNESTFSQWNKYCSNDHFCL